MFPMTPWVLRLLIANVVVFLLSMNVPILFNLGALVPRLILSRPWMPVTYMFLHAGLGHIFFNMIALFFFGPRVEGRLGGSDFLKLYFLSGLGGAAGSFLFAFNAPVVGASGAIFGVLLAFAWFWPREKIYIWGVLPIESRWLVGFMTVVSLWSGISGAQSGVAHFAHLGGFAAGALYLWWHEHRAQRRRRAWQKKVQPQIRKGVPGVGEKATIQRWRSTIPLESLHELNREEVRTLLERAEEDGVGSLKPDERAFLDRMAQM